MCLYVKDIPMEGDAAPFFFLVRQERKREKELNYFYFEKNVDSSLREEKKNIVPHS